MGRVARCLGDDRLSIWYAPPAPHLARYITAYDAYEARLAPGEQRADVFPPAWAAIRFCSRPVNWGVRIGRRQFDPGPPDALFGPTSHAGLSRFEAGRMIGAGLTPLGWARFIGRDAWRFADRVTSLDSIWPERAGRLRAALEAADDPAAAFDGFFTDLLARTEPEEEAVGRLFPLLLDPGVVGIGDLVERMGMAQRPLARVSTTHFGFTPKLLLRRARFMRALVRMLQVERGGWKELVVAAGYHDQSHFVRDCQLFLDMPMSAFVRRPKPLFETSLRLRAAVLGTAAQALHPLEEPTMSNAARSTRG